MFSDLEMKRTKCPTRVRRRTARGGFSLVEVMVVVVIIGMLAGAVAVGVKSYMSSARVNRARSDIATIVDAVESYALENGYPGNDRGLEVLPLKNRTDPWGRPYQYNNPGQENQPFEVFTFGADGKPGGDGEDADIYSWQLGEEAKAAS